MKPGADRICANWYKQFGVNDLFLFSAVVTYDKPPHAASICKRTYFMATLNMFTISV
jgi:hypothetical protein